VYNKTAMSVQLRFALLTTRDPGLTRWQIHKSECSDVAVCIIKGGFVDLVSSRCAEDLIMEEIAVQKNKT
jgi:hypothetical protein